MKTKSHFFSVVIPLYNKANYIQNCIKSVLQQKFSDFELIIINDGSTDCSLQKVEAFTDHRISIKSQTNQGAAAARNHGVDIASAKWIAFLDADDVWKANHLSVLHEAISKFPNESIFTSQAEIIDHKFRTRKATYNFKIPKNTVVLPYFKNSLAHDLLITSGFVIEKEFFNCIGKFDKHIASGQDTDLFIRIGLQKNIVFIPKTTFSYYVNSENNLSQSPRFKERIMLLEKYKKKGSNHRFLKLYLNQNWFSIYLKSKIQEDQNWKLAKSKIDLNCLSFKQKILLKLSTNKLKLVKHLQEKLKQAGIYKSAF